ncbi:hypothetical protein [Flavobacterium psychrophilum]|uniref:Uncharacterized protein n=1 Tax=Flavobacterium psychrophilum TaxID=96345 RepID=A0A7U2NE43_FLAPS|nr:hypothetical protein [Flavobacterium psychrophilum]QRE03496.1 hypothetical protein H0H26_11485 [Flavobacterium psychrophilum]
MIISEDITKHKKEEDIKIATDFLNLMKGKSHQKIRDLTTLIIMISSENAKL